MTRIFKPDSGQALEIQDEGGSAALTINTDGNTVIADGNRIQTDEVRAYDGAGLKLYDDAGAGIFVEDGGNVGIGTTAPAVTLHVKSSDGNMFFDSSSVGQANNLLFRDSAGTRHGQIEFTTTVSSVLTRNTASLNLGSNNAAAITMLNGGNVGIGTTAPGQILDCNSGGGNMIADGYDTHSLAVYKENIEDASGYLDKVLACPAQKWNRKPFVSADEIKKAVLDEFGEDVLIEEAVEAKEAVLDEDRNESEPAVEAKDAVYEKQYSVWDELFPEDNSHRQKALYNMPEGDLKTWIDDWCEAKRVEMRPEDKWQKKRLGLVADAELTAEHLPEVISINDDGEPTGIDTMTYIGILHNAVQELSVKVTALENA